MAKKKINVRPQERNFTKIRPMTVALPKFRWEDGVDQDMRTPGVKDWKKFTLDREEWAKLLKKARAHQGLSSQ